MQPGQSGLVIVGGLEVGEDLGEHVSEEGEELVNPEVVHFVPVLVQDVHARLEPLLLPVVAFNALHNLADFEGGFFLVKRLVRMPKHYQILPLSQYEIE